MVEMVEYIRANPQFIINGSIKAGILAALDGEDTDDNSPGNCRGSGEV